MKSSIKFSVPIEPRPAPRADGGKSTERFSPKWYREWKQTFGLFARRAMNGQPPLTGDIKLSAEFFRLKPKNTKSRNWGDLDNHLKAIKDAMNKICYVDDAQVIRYGECGKNHGPPHIDVTLEEIT